MGLLSFVGNAVKNVTKTISGSSATAGKAVTKTNSQVSAEMNAKLNTKITSGQKIAATENKTYANTATATPAVTTPIKQATTAVTGVSKSKALAGAGLTAAAAVMATAALVQSTSSTQNSSGSDAIHTDPSEGSQAQANAYDPYDYYAYGYQQGLTEADNEWSNWFNSLFGGAEEEAQQIFEPFEEIPFVGDAVSEVKSKGLALPALIGVIIVLAVGGHLIKKKLRRSGHGKSRTHHKRH